ncbi:MAG: HAMP domain-containing sensor histidine kinase [Bacteroidota bacterium]
MAVDLYSNKQKWKIALLVLALGIMGMFLVFSNSIVSKVGDREVEKARQWADAIRKKLELVQLTNRTFSQLRDKERREMSLWIDATKEVSQSSPLDEDPHLEFPFKIINDNKDIPVILLDDSQAVSGHINLDFDTSLFRSTHPSATKKEIQRLFEDSLVQLSTQWKLKNEPFTVEIYEGLFMHYFYNDSKEIVRLEKERDSLLLAFNNELIKNDGVVPVLLLNSSDSSVLGSNLPDRKLQKTELKNTIAAMEAQNEPLVIDFQDGTKNLLYFEMSSELKQLQYFPYVQFSIIGLFILVGYLIFSTFRKAEQNQVWAGMAKETAHQLGTPISSLMAWTQLLESQNIDPMIPLEMHKDIERLTKVTDRFSKIGSGGKLEPSDLVITVKTIIDYLENRISDKVKIIVNADFETIAPHNAPLMEWVIENICKNAVDAMQGKGTLTVTIHKSPEWAHIDIKDTGKGISPKQLKTIFQPGFTTKKRGWGLGLSLVRRIVKDYHKGKVFVLETQVDKGATFRISIPM